MPRGIYDRSKSKVKVTGVKKAKEPKNPAPKTSNKKVAAKSSTRVSSATYLPQDVPPLVRLDLLNRMAKEAADPSIKTTAIALFHEIVRTEFPMLTVVTVPEQESVVSNGNGAKAPPPIPPIPKFTSPGIHLND